MNCRVNIAAVASRDIGISYCQEVSTAGRIYSEKNAFKEAETASMETNGESREIGFIFKKGTVFVKKCSHIVTGMLLHGCFSFAQI